MSVARKYCLLTLLIQLVSRCASIKNHTGHTGDYVFLVAGGQHIPEVQNFTRFMVSLRSRRVTHYFGDNHYCAGVIIDPLWILTSAQCAVRASKIPRRPRSIIVVAGTDNRIEKSPTTSLRAVDRVVSNPNFTFHGTNDIALLRLKRPIQLNERTQIMALPKKPPPYGTRCVVLGWGRLYYKGPFAAAVSHVELFLYTEDQCKKLHPHFSPGDLCAGDNVRFDHDPCRGDAGGPLICNHELVALVSWTFGCGENTYPSLYTDVYSNLYWIRKVISGADRLWVVFETTALLLINLLMIVCF